MYGVQKMGSINVRYDEEGDFLEVTSEKKKGFYKDLGNGIFERVNENGNTIGFAILNTKKRDEKEITIPFEIDFGKKAKT